MEKRSSLYAFLVFGSLLGLSFIFLFALFATADKGDSGVWTSKNGPRIGVVELVGEISESNEFVGILHEMRKDKSLKAIVVRIDSPGGAVGPSQEMYSAILRARKDKKVVCSMGNVAASGGYYIASACDRIYASPGTITGSIGVISQIPNVTRVLELLRVDVETIKSGKLKDIGSPVRPMTSDDREFFQQFVLNIYEQFLTDVASGRHLDKEKLRPIADGRVLTGKQALDAHLIDELGNFEDALDGAARLAGAGADPVPVFKKAQPKTLLGQLLRDAIEDVRPRAKLEARDPRL